MSIILKNLKVGDKVLSIHHPASMISEDRVLTVTKVNNDSIIAVDDAGYYTRIAKRELQCDKFFKSL